MRFLHLLLFSMLFAAAAILLSGCGVSGRTYVTSAGDMIKFRSGGQAREINGVAGVVYPNQVANYGDTRLTNSTGADLPLVSCGQFQTNCGESVWSDCTYNEGGGKVTLACEGGAKATFAVKSDGSLDGPTEGMWKHPEFAHLTRVRN